MLLAINTATSETELALIKDRKVIEARSWISQRDDAEKTFPAIIKLLKDHKLTFQDLKALFVINGPGTFSGVRVGVTIANTLGFSLNVPIYSMNTFELFYRKEQGYSQQSFPILVFLSAGGLYYAVKYFGLEKEELSIGTFQELINKFQKDETLQITGELNAAIQTSIKEQTHWKVMRKIHSATSFGAMLIRLDFTKMTSQKQVAPEYLFPPHITKSKNTFSAVST